MVYILADYAYSRQIWADESAYVVVGIDDDANHYLLASDSGKWGDIGTGDKIIEKVIEYKDQLRTVAVESHSVGYIERRLNELKRENNLTFAFEELKSKNITKPMRIKSTISLFDNGQVYIIDGQRKFESQASRFRGEDMKHGDDIIDAWSYVTSPGLVAKPVTNKTKEEIEKEKNHIMFERWAKQYPDYQKKQAEGMTRRVVHANAMRPSYF
jgi:hypothetical protein